MGKKGVNQGTVFLGKERKILESRTRALSKKIEHQEFNWNHANAIQSLTFDLNGELYAIEAGFINGVISKPDIIPLPGTPRFLRGLFNIRGKILPVFDSKVVLELVEEDEGMGFIIVLEQKDLSIGLLVDSIGEMRLFDRSQFQEETSFFNQNKCKYFKWLSFEGVILLDGKKMLEDPFLVVGEN
jgi:purine-binding chemotaxis protein CheW